MAVAVPVAVAMTPTVDVAVRKDLSPGTQGPSWWHGRMELQMRKAQPIVHWMDELATHVDCEDYET